MIQDVFVVDASAHSYNLGEDNYAVGRYSKAVVDAFYGAHYGLSPVGYRLPREKFTRDWTLAETATMLFVESDYDFACHHVTPINAFKDGGCSIEKAREARERWPKRFQVYAGVDPVFPERALDSLEQQVEELKPVGLKLYPNSYSADGVIGWHMDDPEIAFPVFQRALDLGLKVVAIHKAIPLGPVPMDHYRMDDIDAAAAAFPDLQFEVVHGGFAFIEETAFQLARFPNVWVNLETTSNLAAAKPAAFERVMAGLIAHAGEAALDRIVWASGCSVLHAEPPLRWFWERFQFSEEIREQEGLPEITEEIKRKILGLNYLRMHGLDAKVLAKNIEGDEFAVERAKGKPEPYATTLSKGFTE
ncbi:putative TIM-barrel fold metal-dependent hydrolase [Nitrobacteraceae bacterium AZCC 2161]|jgi:predicted TIM-barrel fold metal-dependent hydrolase